MRKLDSITVIKSFCFAGLLALTGSITGQSLWDTDKSVSVNGDLMDAASGADFIDVVYARAEEIYYTRLDANGAWDDEKPLGTGAEARIAIDNLGNTHIVFTVSGKIAYLKRNGSNWITAEYIESINSGTCSKPDIAVDAGRNVHITYTDTKGNVGNYTDRPDIMYAVNSSGVFVKTLIYNGFLEFYGGADRYAEYFDKGSFIAVDNTGNYYIISHKFQFQTWMGGNDKQYSVVVYSNLGTGGTPIKSSDAFSIHDLENYGNNFYALYQESTFKVSELTVASNIISFSNSRDVPASSVSSLALNGTDVVTGGINSTKLFTQYNNLSHSYEDIVVKGSVVKTVNVDGAGAFFSVYTDNADGNIKVREVAEPLSFTRFWLTEQSGPAIINGQSAAISLKVVNGTSLTNLTASFSTTNDITEVKVGSVIQTSGVTVNDFSVPVTYVITDGVSERTWLLNITEEPAIFSITTSSDPVEGGTTSGGGSFIEGSSVTVSALASEGYVFEHWLEGDIIVSTSDEYSFDAEADRSLIAVFADMYTLTIQTEGTGSVKVNDVTYSGTISVKSGTILNIEAIPGAGYQFTDWKGDILSTENQISLTIDNNKNITATFSLITDVNEHAAVEFEIYPNPFADLITLKHVEKVKRLVITSISGQKFTDIMINGGETINTSDLQSGVYFFVVELFNGIKISRTMVKR